MSTGPRSYLDRLVARVEAGAPVSQRELARYYGLLAEEGRRPALHRRDGQGSRRDRTSPRAKGTNPRARGTNPRALAAAAAPARPKCSTCEGTTWVLDAAGDAVRCHCAP